MGGALRSEALGGLSLLFGPVAQGRPPVEDDRDGREEQVLGVRPKRRTIPRSQLRLGEGRRSPLYYAGELQRLSPQERFRHPSLPEEDA